MILIRGVAAAEEAGITSEWHPAVKQVVAASEAEGG